jgi:hypothetical protein
VTAETFEVPAPTRAAPAPGLAERPPVGGLWRRMLVRATLVPVTVLAPIVALAPTADHRFNIYWHGGLFRDDPLRIVPHTLVSLPGYLRAGNFRPLGRMLEKSLDLAAYLLSEVSGVPANLTFRLVSFAAAVLLCVVAVLLAESVTGHGRLFQRAPSTLSATVPFAVGGGYVAAGRASPVILFGGLYLTSAALVLGVAAVLCRVRPDRGPRARWWPLVLLAGAALAAFNEIAYLALPLATVAVAARGRLVLTLPWRRVLTGGPARVLALLWLGFLPVFVAVRVIIARYCATGPCYSGSDVTVGPAVLEALPARMVGWFPPLMWRSAADGGSRHPWLAGIVLVAAVLVLAALVRHAVRDLARLTIVGTRAAAALAVTAFAVVLLGAGLGALNAGVQRMVEVGGWDVAAWGFGWRDSSVTMAGGALLFTALAQLVLVRRLAITALIVLLAGSAAVSTAANKRFKDTVTGTPAARLDNRLAQAMAELDPTAAGDARRCALRAEFFALFHDSPFSLFRFDQAFDTAAKQRIGKPFCSTSSSGGS